MAVNKIVFGDKQIDLTPTTATADKILSGYGAFGKDGLWMDGTAISGGATVDVVTATPSYNSTSITFSVDAEPKAFMLMTSRQMSLGSTRYTMAVMSDGEDTYGIWGYSSSNTRYCYYSDSYFSWTYNNGSLRIQNSSSTNGGYYRSGYAYRLIYIY